MMLQRHTKPINVIAPRYFILYFMEKKRKNGERERTEIT